MTQEELLLTFCPPAPPERTNVSSRSLSCTPSARIRCSSCASLSTDRGNPLMPPACTIGRRIANRTTVLANGWDHRQDLCRQNQLRRPRSLLASGGLVLK